MDEGLKEKYERERGDFIDRKTGFVERMFDKLFFAVKENILATILVLFIFYNVYLTHLYLQSVRGRLDDNVEYSERIIEEVRRTLRPEIDRTVDRKTQQIERKVDSASNTLNQIKEGINRTIQENL